MFHTSSHSINYARGVVAHPHPHKK
jgi:hypothetical protein